MRRSGAATHLRASAPAGLDADAPCCHRDGPERASGHLLGWKRGEPWAALCITLMLVLLGCPGTEPFFGNGVGNCFIHLLIRSAKTRARNRYTVYY
jgi:hypothetical protein